MASNNIEYLLEKYLEAQTSIAEEKELHDYFSSTQVAPRLEQYKPMFQYFVAAKNETSSKAITLTPQKNYFKWGAIAASFIMLIGFFTFNIMQENAEKEEALLAYYQTKEALQLVSNQFNTGTTKINHLNTFELTTNQIFKSNH